MLQLIFWSAVLSAVMGANSPDGNLFFFFSVHLTMVSIGLFLRRREKRVRTRSALSKPRTD
jgi:hypothetical protein